MKSEIELCVSEIVNCAFSLEMPIKPKFTEDSKKFPQPILAVPVCWLILIEKVLEGSEISAQENIRLSVEPSSHSCLIWVGKEYVETAPPSKKSESVAKSKSDDAALNQFLVGL